MKQTAVEWLKMQLEIRSGIKEITVDSKTFEELCEQAKAMEKEQLKEMYLKGIENYDPTFKQQEQ